MAATSLRVLIAAGGTGGHLFPAIALADQLRAEDADSEVLFVGGTRGLEGRVILPRGYRLATLPVGQLKGKRLLSRVRTLSGLPPAVVRAVGLLRKFRPQVVVGAGGYVSGPLVLAAVLMRKPVLLLEQNAVPGATNRMLSHLASKIVVAFAESAGYFPAKRTFVLGNPLRPDLVQSLLEAEISHDRGPSLLVLGGSQGARPINELMIAAAEMLRDATPGLSVVHQTGAADVERVQQHYDEVGLRARVQPFIEDMAVAYSDADLVLSRAGATTLAELTTAALPAVLIPYPYAADDHQTANARLLVEAGAAVMLRQRGLTAPQLVELLTQLLGNEKLLARMRRSMRALSRPAAAADVVALVRELADGGKGDQSAYTR